jgi:hypothetical protein
MQLAQKSWVPDRQDDRELALRVRKLRWMGMEEDAKRLQLALFRVCPDLRVISSEPSETD